MARRVTVPWLPKDSAGQYTARRVVSAAVAAAVPVVVETAVPAVIATVMKQTGENKDAATISAGMPCALHTSGSGFVLADGTPQRPTVGIATTTGLPGAAMTIQAVGLLFLDSWLAATYSATLTPGVRYFVQTTPGHMGPTPPAGGGVLMQCIGRAVSAMTLDVRFDPPILL